MKKEDKDSAMRKMEELSRSLAELGSLVVAFSGGTDSAFLLYAARRALGGNVLAATARSPLHLPIRGKEAAEFAEGQDVPHEIFVSRETGNPEFTVNNRDRCYHCKKMLFEDLFEIARARGIKNVAHGVNADDLLNYRPGIRAAREAGALEPLAGAGLGKEEIRFLSKEMGLSTWNKPADSCLAARIPYGDPVTLDKLERIARAESRLLEQGFKQVRVRCHGNVARLEVGEEDLERLMDPGLRVDVVRALREVGFQHVCADLEGFISGKLDRE